jgi:hypothetical protein
MARAYAPKWISLADALEYLDFIAADLRTRFIKLQPPVRDRAIVVRSAGQAAERDRSFYYRLLGGDPDYAWRVDDRAREAFINADPPSVDLDLFGKAIEVNRENLVECFPPLNDESGQARAPLEPPRKLRSPKRVSLAERLAQELESRWQSRPPMKVEEIKRALSEPPNVVGKFSDTTLKTALRSAWRSREEV